MKTKSLNPVKPYHLEQENIITKYYQLYLNHVDSQRENQTLWFFLVLMIHGVFFLASPAILIGFYNAPLAVLAVTIVNFFINLIVNMGGAGIRTTLTLFYAGLLVNLAMIVIYVS